MGEHALHHVTIREVAGVLQLDRVEWRLAPVLPLLVEVIRRRATVAPLAKHSGFHHTSEPDGCTPTAMSAMRPICMPASFAAC